MIEKLNLRLFSMATQPYRLELKWWERVQPYIIDGERYLRPDKVYGDSLEIVGKRVVAGAAIVYQEFNLLWLVEDFPDEVEKMSVDDFEKQFASLPRWEATRYAVIYGVNSRDLDDCPSYSAFLRDCQTGARLLDIRSNPVEGREHEVAQLRRAVDLLAKGEPFYLL